jgi:hypothetical protein
VDDFCSTAARFSAIVAALGDVVSEMDLNPVIVHADGCTIVDALVIGRRGSDALESTVRRAV